MLLEAIIWLIGMADTSGTGFTTLMGGAEFVSAAK